jgi:DNA mismatch endonuclease, patch repair protein
VALPRRRESQQSPDGWMAPGSILGVVSPTTPPPPPPSRPAVIGRAAEASGSWASSPQSRSRMQAQRSRDTAPELAIRRLLHSAGLRYKVDRSPILNNRRRADIVFSSVKVAVFIDGCFWHNCPEHGSAPKANGEWWREKLAYNQQRDQDTDRVLTEAGWLPIRVWEHEDAAVAATRIISIVSRRKATNS